MRSRISSLLILMLILALTVQCAKEVDVEAEKEAIAHVIEQLQTAMNDNKGGEWEPYLECFAEDAILMVPNFPSHIGLDAIRTFQNMPPYHTFDIKSKIEEIQVCGEWAFLRKTQLGTMTPVNGGEPQKIDGKFITILKKQTDGSWKIWRDIWNNNTPDAVQLGVEQ